ncbi:MAG: hypothetical protein QNJ36_22250 [Calothrix sp. MO_167.B42]|nr:hypothetical protein [Calothrix sp. MO_167.B42]
MQNNQEELFTKLTPEEAAAVQGGATLELDYLYARNPGQNDPSIMVGKDTVFAKWDVRRNSFAFTKNIKKKITGDTTLSLWDMDVNSGDDLLGYRQLSGRPTRGWQLLKAGGYTMRYRVTR